jgi:phage gp29-like protein
MAEEMARGSRITDEVATIAKDIDIFYGWIKRLENPDPVLRSEAAGKGIKLYDEVDRDAHAGSVLQQRGLAVVGKEWEIVPAASARKQGRPASTSREQVVADFVSGVLENCNFDQARQEILKAILYGFYVVEILWEKTPSGIGIRKLIAKHPRRFSFTMERELRLITPSNMIEGEPVPDRKFVVFTCGDSDNPYGRGLGQRIWWPVWFKKNGVRFWLVFLEKFGMPTVKGKYPPGTPPEQQQSLMDAIGAIQSDTGIKIPDSMDIEFLEASRAGTVTHEQLCEYMDRQISKAVLGQTASTEGTPGKLGNEKEQGDVRQEIIEADADLLDACLNETLIRWIVDYNFPGVSVYPKIKTYAAAKPDLKEQSEIDKTLVVDIGLPVSAAYFYETYGIPVPAEGEELVKPRSHQASPVAKKEDKTGKFAEEKPGDQDAADLIADETARRALAVTDEIYMAPLKRLADEAKDMDDLRDRIIDLWGAIDPENLGVIMAQGMMLAEMAGRSEVKSGMAFNAVPRKKKV